MIIIVRTILELLVMFSLVAGALKLRDDWHRIEPPGWRIVILGFLAILAANAVAVLYSLTKHADISWATLVLLSSYAFFMVTLWLGRETANYRSFRSAS